MTPVFIHLNAILSHKLPPLLTLHNINSFYGLVQGYEDKIRIVLNKADRIDSQQLMRVYGALMWSLGKVLYTPEVTRVYIGSFWDQTLHYDTNRKLFELEEHDLMSDLQSLPCNAALRKLNDLIRRARLAKVSTCSMCQ